MSQVDGISDMALWLCQARAQKRLNGSLPAILSGRKLPSSSHPDAGQLSSFPFVSDALQSAAPMLELRGSESE